MKTLEENPLEQLELLCEHVALIDIGDLPALAELHTEFESIANNPNRFPPAETARAAAALIAAIILDEVPNPGTQVEVLGEMLDYMQRIQRHGKCTGPLPAWLATVPGGANRSESDCPIVEKHRTPYPEIVPFAPAPVETGPAGGELITEELDLMREFFEEAYEHFNQADMHLLTLECDPGNSEAIAAVFRAFHTVKGGAGFLQMRTVQALAHIAESLLDKVRQGSISMEGAVVNLTFEATDGLRRLMQEHDEALDAGVPTPPAPWVQELVERIESAVRGQHPPQRLGEILVESGMARFQDVEDALQDQSISVSPPKLGELMVRTGTLRPEDAVEALRRQQDQRRPQAQNRESIKVDAGRLDRLVDLIGELVIAETMARQSEEVSADPMSPLARRMRHMDKITRELQSISTSLRMVPVQAVFQKMARLVRDLAQSTGKEVEFITQGQDTELDKNVVDLVADPLMHMVRNAVDHGIESPAERVRLGKPEKARVTLRAFHEGGGVYIEIEEDGRGLDRAAILERAVERGLTECGDHLPDREVWNFIFEPGFSTAKQVTDVSGRGVGMDVVRRNINALHGSIDIRSKAGKGTTISLRLPLTLAIIDGMVLSVGDERYIVPIGGVVRATRPESEDIHTVKGRGELLSVRGRLIPLFRLHNMMEIRNAVEDPAAGIVLVLDDNGRQIGLLADDLLGQQQVVIKPLGKGVGNVLGLAGGAIMPDGTVGLVLDVAGLFRRVRRNDADPQE